MFPIVLRREILLLIALKAAVLTLLYVLFFSPAHRLEASPQTLRTHLMGP